MPLETATFNRLENEFWLLPSDLAFKIRQAYLLIREENQLLNYSKGRDNFRINDIWGSLRNELPQLRSLIAGCETAPAAESPSPSPNARDDSTFKSGDEKQMERTLLLRKVFDSRAIQTIGREFQEAGALRVSGDKSVADLGSQVTRLGTKRKKWDVFVCHASEDKDAIVRPLANALKEKGLGVWYDEFELQLGDSLRRKIDQGLSDSRFGIVVLSRNFFVKEWTQKELDGLVAKEDGKEKVILPIWHDVDKDYVKSYSPILADKLAVSTNEGLDKVVSEVLKVVQGTSEDFDAEKVTKSPTTESPTSRDELEQWVLRSKERWHLLVDERLSHEKPSRYSKGIWTVAYKIMGNFNLPKLSNLLAILKEVSGHESGWPPWWVPTRPEIAPYAQNGLIECWLAEGRLNDPMNSDFWLASPKGMMFLLRGYEDDSPPCQLDPGTAFDVIIPVWRVGECLLHAARLSRALSANSITIRFTWEGLSGRTLTSWANPRRMVFPGRRSRQDSVTAQTTILTDQVNDGLPEIVKTITTPLYEIFDFFEIPSEVIQEELSKMWKSKL
jgi:hypothetical protein